MIQTIGFIGVGLIGSSLARLAVDAGYKVVLSNSREPASLERMVELLGGESVASADTPQNICSNDNIKLVVLTVPLNVIPSLIPALGGLKDKIVVDTNNYYPHRDGHVEALDSRKLNTAEYVAQYLDKSAKQIKVFNNIWAIHIQPAASRDSTNQTYLPVAGDDVEAKGLVREFVKSIGFGTVDAGSLRDSWKIEPNTPVYCKPYAPVLPEGLTEQEAVRYFGSHAAAPLTEGELVLLVSAATGNEPVGGVFDPNSISSRAMINNYAH